MQRPIENKLNNNLGHSGNSDVDVVVTVDVDTKAIAYGMLCSLYAKGELNDMQLEKAIQKLDGLLERDRKKQTAKNKSSENNAKLFDFPHVNTKRGWF
ncbi:hypothetical protein [Bacillus sinesaloumensis]|uniref:hypothetical protein n=1 Tax=Litchfieldia sinesaloumensis TaxID=1926280 RepID=UPI0009883466|nr:hypothetical protein [Bacillus sinesaloumensis]